MPTTVSHASLKRIPVAVGVDHIGPELGKTIDDPIDKKTGIAAHDGGSGVTALARKDVHLGSLAP